MNVASPKARLARIEARADQRDGKCDRCRRNEAARAEALRELRGDYRDPSSLPAEEQAEVMELLKLAVPEHCERCGHVSGYDMATYTNEQLDRVIELLGPFPGWPDNKLGVRP